MKLEESTVLVVLHSFLSTFGFRTCYYVEDFANCCSSPSEPSTFIMLSQEQPPGIGGNAASIKSPVTCLPKRLPKLSCFWQTVSIIASSLNCFLFSDYNTLADVLLFLKQYSCNFRANSKSRYYISSPEKGVTSLIIVVLPIDKVSL